MAGQGRIPVANVPRRRVRPAQQPVVHQALQQKQVVIRSESSLLCACAALLGALAVAGDL